MRLHKQLIVDLNSIKINSHGKTPHGICSFVVVVMVVGLVFWILVCGQEGEREVKLFTLLVDIIGFIHVRVY